MGRVCYGPRCPGTVLAWVVSAPFLEVGHFGPILFYIVFLGNIKFFTLARLMLCTFNKK